MNLFNGLGDGRKEGNEEGDDVLVCRLWFGWAHGSDISVAHTEQGRHDIFLYSTHQLLLDFHDAAVFEYLTERIHFHDVFPIESGKFCCGKIEPTP